ncbi:DUF2378 family protein [Candidatus Uhrbacteria bacterium]|nr:DUF2378 family protein [Candidatus Uhrbacteria bacterium]
MQPQARIPTIKGLFVMSHIRALRASHGQQAVQDLERRYGKSIAFAPFEEVPVREEVAILEHIIAITTSSLASDQRAYEAGRLHFRNFTETPFGRIIFSQFRTQFKRLMMNAGYVAGHVFRNVQFSSREGGSTSVIVTIRNNDYPIDHFRGLFQAWMEYAGLRGTVRAREIPPDGYEYLMTWED